MFKVIVTAMIYLLTMVLAYVLKKTGLFHKEDKKTLSNLIFYVTLPASLISGFTDAKVNVYYVVAILIGLGVNTVMVISGQVASRHKSPELRAIYSVNASGYNMACIAIPFLSNFFPAGIPYLCMFDVGDSFYTLGTTYVIAQMRLKGKNDKQNIKDNIGQNVKQKESNKQNNRLNIEQNTEYNVKINELNRLNKSDMNIIAIIKSLFTSVPFDVYFVMTILSFMNIRLPDVVVQAADFCGRGNGFLAMMMIGISLELSMSRETMKEVIHLLSLRYIIGIVSAVLIYCILPAPLVMRQILSAAVFSSSAAVSIIYCERLGISTDISAALNPLSTIFMIPLMVVVILLIG